MVIHNGQGWVGAEGRYYPTAALAHDSIWANAEEIYSEGSITRSEALSIEPPATVAMPSEIRGVTLHINRALWEEVRKDPDKMFGLHHREFEKLVAELYHREGFDVRLTPQTWDGGRDLVAIRRSSSGSKEYIVECKRYAPHRKVGADIVLTLYGVLTYHRSHAAVLATTSEFTRPAREIASKLEWQMELKDFTALKKWISEIR